MGTWAEAQFYHRHSLKAIQHQPAWRRLAREGLVREGDVAQAPCYAQRHRELAALVTTSSNSAVHFRCAFSAMCIFSDVAARMHCLLSLSGNSCQFDIVEGIGQSWNDGHFAAPGR